MKTYIGIDFGTTNIKAALFDENGTQLHLERVPTPLRTDCDGSIYDPEEIFGILRQLLDAMVQPNENPAGIVVTGMAEAGIALNRHTKVCLSPIIPWFDERTVPYAERLTPEQSYGRFLKTGLRNSFKYGIYKYLWCLDHCDTPAEETVWLSAVDYLAFLLTGDFVTDPTFAARTYAYDLAAGDFDIPWLTELGLSRSNFPRIVDSGDFAGVCILPGWEKISVHIGAHDHVCAAYGMHFADETAICNSCGTAETYMGTMPSGPLTEQNYKAGCIYGPYPGGKQYFWMANISSSGLSVEWYREKLQLTAPDYDQVEAALSEPKEPTGIFFLPALTGMGTPCFRQDFSAAFLGLHREHTGADLLRAVVEGIGFQGRMILEPVCGQKRILSVGGATRSSGWMQRKANVMGCEILALDQSEATITGAIAMMIRHSEGAGSVEAFCRNLTGRKRYVPDARIHGLYNALYPRYRKWYEAALAQLDE